MSQEDPLSRSMREGFAEAITTAEKNMALDPHLLEDSLAQAFSAITLDSSIQADELKSHLHAEFYGRADKNSHALIALLQQRLQSAKILLFQFEAGIAATEIQNEIRDYYYHSQCWIKS